MKPSPVAPEIVSMKRSRSAPRTSALKRKVLMDDMMVLHGEYVSILFQSYSAVKIDPHYFVLVIE